MHWRYTHPSTRGPAKTLQTAEELVEWVESLPEPALGFSITMAEKRLTVVYRGNKGPRPNPPLPKRFEKERIKKRVVFERRQNYRAIGED